MNFIYDFSCWIYFLLFFSAISVEMYYIFSTLWGRDQYTLYGILGLVFVILISVTACMSITLTYFQLSSEDYRWWWRAIFSAGLVLYNICIIIMLICLSQDHDFFSLMIPIQLHIMLCVGWPQILEKRPYCWKKR